MTPEEIKALRKELSCTAKELAAALGVDQATVLGWEAAQRFPTKSYVERMTELRTQGPDAIPRKKRGTTSANPFGALADPGVWELVRKLTAHKKLRDDVSKLAQAYPDPAHDLASEGPSKPKPC